MSQSSKSRHRQAVDKLLTFPSQLAYLRVVRGHSSAVLLLIILIEYLWRDIGMEVITFNVRYVKIIVFKTE